MSPECLLQAAAAAWVSPTLPSSLCPSRSHWCPGPGSPATLPGTVLVLGCECPLAPASRGAPGCPPRWLLCPCEQSPSTSTPQHLIPVQTIRWASRVVVEVAVLWDVVTEPELRWLGRKERPRGRGRTAPGELTSQTQTWWVSPHLRALGVFRSHRDHPQATPTLRLRCYCWDEEAVSWGGGGGTLPCFLGSCLESERQSQHLRGPLESRALGSSAIRIPNLSSIPIPGSKFGNQ